MAKKDIDSFSRFQYLAKRLLSVPKEESKEQEPKLKAKNSGK